jgi:phosphoglycerol transferase MdoB-like AlkP superfamily enzyme
LFPLRTIVFFVLLFALFRVWFVLWHHTLWQPGGAASAFASLYHGLPLDLSAAGYLCLVPLLAWTIADLLGGQLQAFFKHFLSAYGGIMVALLVLICGANVFLYSEWNTVLGQRALGYLRTPRALLDSMSTGFVIVCIGLYVGLSWLFWKAWQRWVTAAFEQPNRWATTLTFPLWLALLVLLVRGGTGVMAINESAVYYSQHLFDNHAATNPAWHLVHTQLEQKNTRNLYEYTDENTAKGRVSRLLAQKDGTRDTPVDFLKNDVKKPLNLVLVVMESMTAQVISELGGTPDVCPNMSRLIGSSILFENCYSSGFRTDQGLISVLAGYPAQPDQSIIFQPDKAANLNSLPKLLGEQGYSTLYCMGGEPTFANIGVWMANQRLGKVISEGDFPASDKTQRWGVDDKRLLKRFVQEIDQLPQPFMATAITLSLHPPFDVPHKSRWEGSTDGEKFLHSANFADEAIGEFFDAIQHKPWFENTIFVFVADHGAVHPAGVAQHDPIARHIPLVLFGAPLADRLRGTRNPQVGNHHDIPATCLALLEKDASAFTWSRNLLSPPAAAAGGFAYCANENGLLWITPSAKAFFTFADRRWQMLQGQLSPDEQADALAYLQVFYGDFLGR